MLDRAGAVAGPLLVAALAAVVPALACSGSAVVVDLVPAGRRATAYGVFAAVQGGAAVVGGALAGALYQTSLPALIAVVVATRLVALTLLVAILQSQRTSPSMR